MSSITNSVTIFAFANHIIFAVLLFGISLALTFSARYLRILDLPNARSSHTAPTPRTGGLAIVATCAIGFGVIYFKSDDARILEPCLLGFWYMARQCVGKGHASDFHQHDDREQVYYILEGEGTVVTGFDAHHVQEGDTIYLPRGVPHVILNDRHAGWLSYLVVS